MSVPPKKPTPVVGWSARQIDEEKARVRAELDRAQDPNDRHSRLHAALRQVAALEGDDSDEGRLRRYVFAMSALVQHERGGGLKRRDIEGLVALAYAILQTQGVRPRASRLASLYGDVHLIRSQIYRKEGAPWHAAWEQQVALQLAGEFPSGGLGFQVYAMAGRSLRLGHARLALEQLAEAEAAGLPETARERAALTRVQACWLAGDHVEAAAAAAAARLMSPGLAVARELDWLDACRSAQAQADLSSLMTTTRRGGRHHEATYLIEACVWSMAVESRDLMARMPSLAAKRRNEALRPALLGLWYDAGVTLQQCYDHEIPLPVRLRALGGLLERRGELITVDKELLVLAAATRWLARSKAAPLAKLVYHEYRALSRRLTDGRSDDTLGVLTDIASRPWLAPPPA